MTRIAAFCLASLIALGPAAAQDITPEPEAPGDMREGMDLLGEGMRLFFKGLGDEMEPALRDFAESMEPALRDLAQHMQPAMRKLMELVDDFDAYELPERLPNGDIIIRRKPDAPEPAPEGEIEI